MILISYILSRLPVCISHSLTSIFLFQKEEMKLIFWTQNLSILWNSDICLNICQWCRFQPVCHDKKQPHHKYWNNPKNLRSVHVQTRKIKFLLTRTSTCDMMIFGTHGESRHSFVARFQSMQILPVCQYQKQAHQKSIEAALHVKTGIMKFLLIKAVCCVLETISECVVYWKPVSE